MPAMRQLSYLVVLHLVKIRKRLPQKQLSSC
jgi:hypothetical protein